MPATKTISVTSSNIPPASAGLVRLGQYIYIAPGGTGTPGNTFAPGRYDTKTPFDADGGAFDTYYPSAVPQEIFGGGCTDGKRVYFAPYLGQSSNSTVLVYDPNSVGFSSDNSWTVQDIQTFHSGAAEFFNCVFDGQYVYFGVGPGTLGFVARYDTMHAITDSNAWVFFQATQINGVPPRLSPPGFAGLVYTGRYIVFVPSFGGSYPYPPALSYDTQGKFGDLTSWTSYPFSTSDAGSSGIFFGGQFDGRYVYLAPEQDGIVMRWDTTLPFSASSSWEALNLAAIHAGASQFTGTAFDGQYVYFSAGNGNTMARFKARDTVANITPTPSFF